MTTADPQLARWSDTARAALVERDAATWRLADVIADGRRDRGKCSVTALAASLNITAHRLRDLARVADAFPPDRRAAVVPFDVHAHLARLDEAERFDTLATATAEGWGEKQARAVATQHRQEAAGFDDEDLETRQGVALARLWNRSCPDARAYFAALAEGAGTGIIDEDADAHD